jgi:hypothetical protein
MQVAFDLLPQIMAKVKELYPNDNFSVVASEVYQKKEFPHELYR